MRFCFLVSIFLCFFTTFLHADSSIVPVDLRCELLEKPLGIDVANPRFSWICDSSENLRDEGQTAYQIILSDSDRNVWDSGRVESEECSQIVYGGPSLKSGTSYSWKVRIWDRKNQTSSWSTPTTFSTGLFEESDWKNAQWIAAKNNETWKSDWTSRKQKEDGIAEWTPDLWKVFSQHQDLPWEPDPLFRKTVELSNEIMEAKVYVCGLGYFDFSINGRKISDHCLTPAVTDYDKRVLYSTFDVSENLKRGKNTLGVQLGRGWYCAVYHDVWDWDRARYLGQPRFILRLHVRYKNGTEENFVSDESWKTMDGPIRLDGPKIGEVYDAREEKRNWNIWDYDDSQWIFASKIEPPKGKLAASMLPPIRVTDTLQPVETIVQKPEPGSIAYRYKFGRNIAGHAKIKVKGKSGTQLKLEFFESDPPKYSQGAYYICSGQGEEEYEPTFAYYGFQFMRISGPENDFSVESVEAKHVYTDLDVISSFECSHPLVNRLQAASVLTGKNLVHSYPEDCPHFEKLGWTDHCSLMADTVFYNFDAESFYTKWMMDFKDNQRSNGALSYVIPTHDWGFNGEVCWSGAYVSIPWRMYLHYGDKGILKEHYEPMKLWLDNVHTWSGVADKPFIVDGGCGDWVPPHNPPNNPAPPEGGRLVNSCFYHSLAVQLSKMAEVLGHQEDKKKYEQFADDIKNAINRYYFDPAKHEYHTERNVGYRQASQIFPLLWNLAPKEEQGIMIEKLIEDITVRQNNHLNTGTMGTHGIMKLLPQLGYADLAFTIATQTTYPSWGNWLVNEDSTTLWEGWSLAERSYNHSCFMNLSSYFFESLAGIKPDSNRPGYKNILIAPDVVENLDFVKCRMKTVQGTVVSSWKKIPGGLEMEIAVPLGATAQVRIPKRFAKDAPFELFEGENRFWNNGKQERPIAGIRHAEESRSSIQLQLGSGQYRFQMQVRSASARAEKLAITLKNRPEMINLFPGKKASVPLSIENNGETDFHVEHFETVSTFPSEISCLAEKQLPLIVRKGTTLDFPLTVALDNAFSQWKFVPMACKISGKAFGNDGRGKNVELDVRLPLHLKPKINQEILTRNISLAPGELKTIDWMRLTNLCEQSSFAVEWVPEVPQGWNITCGATIITSDEAGPGIGTAGQAIDGIVDHQYGNRWHSRLDVAHPHWLEIRLVEKALVDRVVIQNTTRNEPKRISIEICNENKRWREVARKEFQPMLQNELSFTPVKTDTVRVIIHESYNAEGRFDYAQLNEIEIFGRILNSQGDPQGEERNLALFRFLPTSQKPLQLTLKPNQSQTISIQIGVENPITNESLDQIQGWMKISEIPMRGYLKIKR